MPSPPSPVVTVTASSIEAAEGWEPGIADTGAIQAFTFRSTDGRRTTVSNLGLAVTSVWTPDRAGTLRNVVLSHRSPTAFVAGSGYLGVTVGRVANRIAGAVLPGPEGRLPLVPNEGRHQLHGGPGGLHRRSWRFVDLGATDDGRGAWVRFDVTSPDGDQGFPGNLDVVATVSFDVADDRACLSFRFEATTDAPTPVSLAHHGYWALAGAGRGTVDDQCLTVHADRFVPVDDEMIPTGEVWSVEGTPFDLRHGARLGERLRADHPQIGLGRGLDHGFIVGDPHAITLEEREVAVLVDPSCGRRLTVHTDQPGLQVYAGGAFDGSLRGADGQAIRQGDAVAFEPQRLANAVHHPRTYGDVWLHPGERYLQRTRFVLDVVHGSTVEP